MPVDDFADWGSLSSRYAEMKVQDRKFRQCTLVQRHSQIYKTNRSLFDKCTKIGTNIHYYTMNIFRY